MRLFLVLLLAGTPWLADAQVYRGRVSEIERVRKF